MSLIGIRIGATLACRYALDHPVDSLVLWAPCERGAAYVRELMVLNRMSSGSRPPQEVVAEPADRPDGLLEVVGFEFGSALLDELAATSLLTEIDRPPARRVLVLDRDDIAPSTALTDAVRATGAATDQAQTAGWAQFMVPDETQSEIPVAALHAIAAWMGPEAAERPSIGPVPQLRRRNGHSSSALHVETHLRGCRERTAGVDRSFVRAGDRAAAQRCIAPLGCGDGQHRIGESLRTGPAVRAARPALGGPRLHRHPSRSRWHRRQPRSGRQCRERSLFAGANCGGLGDGAVGA